MRIFFLWATAVSLLAQGSQYEDPEKKISISVQDLLGKNIDSYSLPSDYGSRIASLVSQARPKMIECLGFSRAFPPEVRTVLEINQSGQGKISETADPTLSCIYSILAQISFPKHRLKTAVDVKISFALEKETL